MGLSLTATRLRPKTVKLTAAPSLPRLMMATHFLVDSDYVRKHKPEVGGYYVVYEGRLQVILSAAAFESGYTVLTANA